MIIRTIGAVAGLFIGWIGVLAGVMVLSDAAPSALVVFPSADFFAALPADVAITGETAIGVTVTGEAAILYRAGAWLVLPAGLLGCAPLTS